MASSRSRPLFTSNGDGQEDVPMAGHVQQPQLTQGQLLEQMHTQMQAILRDHEKERQRSNQLESRLQEANLAAVAANQRFEQRLQALTSASTPVSPSPALREQRSPRHPDPGPYDGDLKTYDKFRSDLCIKMTVNHDWYPTSQDNLRYCISRLEGKARKQFEYKISFDASGLVMVDFTGLQAFLQSMDVAFGDHNKQEAAKQKLNRCYQTNRAFSVWYSEFQTLAIDARYQEDWLKQLMEQQI